jgi:pseudouridine-5'-phosphate glycosidase
MPHPPQVNLAKAPWCRPSKAVQRALKGGGPVVAIETTLFTHGFSPTIAAELLDRVQSVVRLAGAVPAVIGVRKGQLQVGIEPDDIEHYVHGASMPKLGSRDLAGALARGESGATTVSATLQVAAQLGIQIQMTGGIGGVHLGAAETFDISADLIELARSPVTLVCSGAKPILDLPKTLELLETAAVPVVGWECGEFPAFLTNETGLKLAENFQSAADLARFIAIRRQLHAGTALLVAVPVPADYALPGADVTAAVAAAKSAAGTLGVRGKALTPFLLSRIALLTGGRSTEANTALIEANARRAAELAVACQADTAVPARRRAKPKPPVGRSKRRR